MSETLDVGAALDTLLGAKSEAEYLRARQQDLAEYAGRLLREKAALVLTMPTRPEWEHEAGDRVLLYRATVSVPVAGSYIVLLDNLKSRNAKGSELIVIEKQEPKHLQLVQSGPEADKNTLVLFESGSQVMIPKVESIEAGHLEVIDVLLHHIDQWIEPVGETGIGGLPRMSTEAEGARISHVFGGILNLRSSAAVIATS